MSIHGISPSLGPHANPSLVRLSLTFSEFHYSRVGGETLLNRVEKSRQIASPPSPCCVVH
ncbi:hypothetical protein H4R33_005464, partial [Dimargaris cristalligena]